MGVQWKSAWLKTKEPRIRASPTSQRCGPWARHIYPSLVLVQPRKTHPCLTERLLMGRKESNQTKAKFYTTICTLGPKYPLYWSVKSYKGRVFSIWCRPFNFSKKMQTSFKHGSYFGEFGCKTPQQLFSLSNTVDAIKYHVNCIGETE